MDGMPFLSPNEQCQSTKGLMDIHFYRQRDAWPAAQPSVSMQWWQSY